MAKKTAKKTVKKTAKKVVKKVLDSTELDEKIVAEYKENKTIIDSILCYVKCYGGYVLAVGAGCTFGLNFKLGLSLFLISGAWAYWQVCCCKPCKTGKDNCCNKEKCEK
jgi:hypothetical protein